MPQTPQALLFDVMDTIVYDPIAEEIPQFFDLSITELYRRNHPTAWVEFEKGTLSESTFYEIYFPQRPKPIDGRRLRQILYDAYRYLDGMEALLERLNAGGHDLYALSNYPLWSQIIEDKLHLSRYLSWSFVSWKTGVRKPDPAAYQQAAKALQLPCEQCLFIDDRRVNCQAARDVGMAAIQFEDARQLTRQLRNYDLL